MVIFKLKSKIFTSAQMYTIDYKNANETQTKTLKYLHRNNTIDYKNANETLTKTLKYLHRNNTRNN